MSIEKGAKAPDFTLMNQDRQPVTLSMALQAGPVVLAFFPAAFSSVCQTEMCTFRDSLATLGAAKAQVFGVSTDTFFALKAWSDQQHFGFPLLSDYNKDVIRAVRRRQSRHDWAEGHRQAVGVRHRSAGDGPAPRGARGCAE